MIKEALEYLIWLTPHREKIGEIEYTDRPLAPVVPPRPAYLKFPRLQGFADFIGAERETFSRETTLIHVVSPWEVRFMSVLSQDHRDREQYAAALVDSSRGFQFGKFMTPEEFTIAVQTLFADSSEARPNDKVRLLELAGTVTSEFLSTSEDDGITQTVSAKAGVKLQKKKPIENPFTLAPHRTFAEVEQPRSPFILRARGMGSDAPPHFALFECDNQQWQLEAVDNLQVWLEGKLKETGIPILA